MEGGAEEVAARCWGVLISKSHLSMGVEEGVEGGAEEVAAEGGTGGEEEGTENEVEVGGKEILGGERSLLLVVRFAVGSGALGTALTHQAVAGAVAKSYDPPGAQEI